MPDFRSNLKVNQNKIIEAALDPRATAPSTPVPGQIYFNSSTGEMLFYDGTQWVSMYGGISDVTGTSPVSVTVTNHVANISVALATPSSDGLMPAADKAKLDAATDAATASTLVLRDANGDASFNLITLTGVPTDPNHVIRKADLDAAVAGLDFQPDVIDVQVDASLDPGASPTTGARYIITNAANLHANFGTISGLQDNDIVEYDGSQWVVAYDVSVQGEGALAWVQAQDKFYKYDGVVWTEFGGLAGVTAGDGLYKSGNTMNIGAADTSIALEPDAIRVNVDGLTLEVDAGQGVRVKASGIDETHISSTSFGPTISGGSGTLIDVVGYTVVSGATVARKREFTVTITGGGATDTITHGLNTQHVNVSVWDASTNELVFADVKASGANDVQITANGASFTARVVVIG